MQMGFWLPPARNDLPAAWDPSCWQSLPQVAPSVPPSPAQTAHSQLQGRAGTVTVTPRQGRGWLTHWLPCGGGTVNNQHLQAAPSPGNKHKYVSWHGLLGKHQQKKAPVPETFHGVCATAPRQLLAEGT